ncbi:VTT domain-containing protein [Catalinimonas sp. 4WD22]|uniref:TVP38/TMEM64 family protein n=1 Tax=Catalinimonas locisalis TaxID=3133978 RepID=UPI003100D30A
MTLFTQILRTNRRSALLTLWMAIVPLTVSSLITLYALSHEQFIQTFGQLEWAVFFVLSCFSMALALTPTTFIALLSGYFLGMLCAPFVIIAYILASFLGYQLTHVIDNGHFIQTIRELPGGRGEKALRFLDGIQHNQFGLIIMARISPVLPFAIMNVLLPIAGVRLKEFLLAGTIGMLPRTLLFIWLGSQAQELRTLIEEGRSDFTAQLMFVVLLAISVFGLLYYGKRILSKYVQ